MSLTAVRQVAIDQTFRILGVDVVVTPPNGSPVETRAVWDAADIEGAGRGRQLRRAMWLPTSDELPSVPRGTVIVGPEPHSTESKTWRWDQKLSVEPGKIQGLVVEVKS